MTDNKTGMNETMKRNLTSFISALGSMNCDQVTFDHLTQAMSRFHTTLMQGGREDMSGDAWKTLLSRGFKGGPVELSPQLYSRDITNARRDVGVYIFGNRWGFTVSYTSTKDIYMAKLIVESGNDGWFSTTWPEDEPYGTNWMEPDFTVSGLSSVTPTWHKSVPARCIQMLADIVANFNQNTIDIQSTREWVTIVNSDPQLESVDKHTCTCGDYTLTFEPPADDETLQYDASIWFTKRGSDERVAALTIGGTDMEAELYHAGSILDQHNPNMYLLSPTPIVMQRIVDIFVAYAYEEEIIVL